MSTNSGRVKMPHNNRMHSSATLRMTGIWKNTIGYDPYAAKDEVSNSDALSSSAYEQSKGLMDLVRLSNKGTENRGGCKKCGMMGHLSFQCRNVLQKNSGENSESSTSSSEDEEEVEDGRDKGTNVQIISSHTASQISETRREHKRSRRDSISSDSSDSNRKKKKHKSSREKKRKEKKKKHVKSKTKISHKKSKISK